MKFYALFAEVCGRRDLTSSAKVLSAVVFSRCVGSGRTMLSYSLAAEIAGMTTSMARRGLLLLQERGIICRTQRHSPGRGSTYEVPGLEIEAFRLDSRAGHRPVTAVLRYKDGTTKRVRRQARDLLETCDAEKIRGLVAGIGKSSSL